MYLVEEQGKRVKRQGQIEGNTQIFLIRVRLKGYTREGEKGNAEGGNGSSKREGVYTMKVGKRKSEW